MAKQLQLGRSARVGEIPPFINLTPAVLLVLFILRNDQLIFINSIVL